MTDDSVVKPVAGRLEVLGVLQSDLEAVDELVETLPPVTPPRRASLRFKLRIVL
ncbi:MAG: hypothetical protein IT376_10915 [Polyangiaceae bacterium]|nr:hypothetical protein [Polyangiaceae bacterium]